MPGLLGLRHIDRQKVSPKEGADDCAVDGVLDSPPCPVNDLGAAEDLDSSCDVLVLGLEDETGVLDEITRVVGDEVAVAMAQLVFATVLTENTRGGGVKRVFLTVCLERVSLQLTLHYSLTLQSSLQSLSKESVLSVLQGVLDIFDGCCHPVLYLFSCPLYVRVVSHKLSSLFNRNGLARCDVLPEEGLYLYHLLGGVPSSFLLLFPSLCSLCHICYYLVSLRCLQAHVVLLVGFHAVRHLERDETYVFIRPRLCDRRGDCLPEGGGGGDLDAVSRLQDAHQRVCPGDWLSPTPPAVGRRSNFSPSPMRGRMMSTYAFRTLVARESIVSLAGPPLLVL